MERDDSTMGIVPEEWFEVAEDSLEYQVRIGRGGFGEVWKGRFLGTPVAIKRMQCADETQAKYISRELSAALHMVHPHIIQMLGLRRSAGVRGNEVILVMELMDLSLADLLYKRGTPLSTRQRLAIALHTARAMRYLHARSVVHRDLKSANILLAESTLFAKVCDFGLARRLTEDNDGRAAPTLVSPRGGSSTSSLERAPSRNAFLHMTVVGSPPWTAPEILLEREYGAPVDVFSFGALLYELICRKVPPMRRDTKTGNQAWRTMEPEPSCPPVLWDLMLMCTETDPLLRPSFADILDRLEAMSTEIGDEEPQPVGTNDTPPSHEKAASPLPDDRGGKKDRRHSKSSKSSKSKKKSRKDRKKDKEDVVAPRPLGLAIPPAARSGDLSRGLSMPVGSISSQKDESSGTVGKTSSGPTAVNSIEIPQIPLTGTHSNSESPLAANSPDGLPQIPDRAAKPVLKPRKKAIEAARRIQELLLKEVEEVVVSASRVAAASPKPPSKQAGDDFVLPPDFLATSIIGDWIQRRIATLDSFAVDHALEDALLLSGSSSSVASAHEDDHDDRAQDFEASV